MRLIEVTADEAQAHGLPPFFCRVDLEGTPLSAGKFGQPNSYLTVSGPPGGTVLAIVWTTDEHDEDAAAIERSVQKHYAQRATLQIGRTDSITIAGRERPALSFTTGEGFGRVSWCAVIVTSGDGAVLVALGLDARARTHSCAEIVAFPDLAVFVRTFAVRERGMPAPSGVRIRGWAQALAEKAVKPRAMGALLGLAVGDALGTTNEFKALAAPAFPDLATGPVDHIVGGGPFKLAPGQVTDDTQMAAVIADRFISSDHFIAADIGNGYLAWREVAFDVGVQIRQVLDEIANGTSAAKAGQAVWNARDRLPAGNGSLMRTAVIGVLLAGMDLETRRRATFIDSTITHFDPRCVLACAAFNAAIAHALTEKPSPSSMVRAAAAELDGATKQLRMHYGTIGPEIDAARAALASDLEAAREDDPHLYNDELHLHKTGGFVRVAFRLAFWELMHAPDYRSAVIDAANRGGDADTNAAIVGALLGAFHGVDSIPSEWRDKVLAAEGLRAGKLDLHPRVFVRALEEAYGPTLRE